MAVTLACDPADKGSSQVQVEATHSWDEQKACQREIPVILPDLFVSFLSRKPQLNPHHETVGAESEAWILENCQLSPNARKKISKGNFPYFIAIVAREAEPDEYRTLCDWSNWVFPFDDMFDEGLLKDDPEKASLVVQQLLAGLTTTDSEKELPQSSPLVEAHNSIWFRFAKKASRGARERFVRSMTDYCNGLLEQVQSRSRNTVLDPKAALETRRKTIGVTPLLPMIEYYYNLDLPDEVFEHKSITELGRVATDLVLLHNDLLSYSIEQREGDDHHNVVALYRLAGMGPQEAFDQMGNLLKDRLRDWHLALAELPQWGEAIDTQIQKYIGAVQDIALANLNWSFKSERYFGKQNTLVRKTRVLHVLPL